MLGKRSRRILYPSYMDYMLLQYPHVGRLRDMGELRGGCRRYVSMRHAGTYRGHPCSALEVM
jgi:hypothetical protein